MPFQIPFKIMKFQRVDKWAMTLSAFLFLLLGCIYFPTKQCKIHKQVLRRTIIRPGYEQGQLRGCGGMADYAIGKTDNYKVAERYEIGYLCPACQRTWEFFHNPVPTN